MVIKTRSILNIFSKTPFVFIEDAVFIVSDIYLFYIEFWTIPSKQAKTAGYLNQKFSNAVNLPKCPGDHKLQFMDINIAKL